MIKDGTEADFSAYTAKVTVSDDDNKVVFTLFVNTIGFGPEVEPEVNEIKASRLALKVCFGTKP